MQLLTYKTLWGHPDFHAIESLALACAMAVDNGFAGIEGQIPGDEKTCEQLAMLLDKDQLSFIAEICTAGSYVPDRRANVQEHLDDLSLQLYRVAPLHPQLVNCIGGCDRWSLDESVQFFQQAMELADQYSVAISFETHRGRSLYSPWVAEQLLSKMDLPLTCDFSHWCVVCEGLGASEDDLLREVARHACHIHGRVGYDQGPQVSDPQSFLYRDDLHKHLRWWRWIWQAQREKGRVVSTFTPEFGPDGYQMVNPASGEPVGDLSAINLWMATAVRHNFEQFLSTAHELAGDVKRETGDGKRGAGDVSVPSPISRSNISPIL